MRRARPLLGTLVDIQATGADAVAAIEAAFFVVADIHRLMSFHEPESDVSRINRGGEAAVLSVSPQTHEVLDFARELSLLTEGAFDITVAKELVDAGFLPKPANASIVAPNSSYRDLELLPSPKITLAKSVWIDLGGIAKGYAVDSAIATLRSYEVDSALVNAGGDLRFFGQAQPIRVRHPDKSSSFVSLGFLENCAVATSSGSSCRNQDQLGLDPLVDADRHICIRWGQSVSVIAPNCMTADALTKVVRLCPQGAKQILEYFGAEAVITGLQGALKYAGLHSEKRCCA